MAAALDLQSAAVLSWCRERGIDPAKATEQLDAEIAKHYLTRFGARVLPWFVSPRHIEYLADLLERAERGEIRRLAISAPPGHGKSTLLQAFLGFFIGRDPRRRILALSASESLAKRNSRMTRAIVQSESWPWPDVRLVGESLEEWYTTQGGGVRAIGRTGNVTGFRAEMILLDDVQPDAGSETSRRQDQEWFGEIVSTRLEPGGIIVDINTRWHDDDLIGSFRETDQTGDWVFVNLPAIAGDDDLLGREPGTALWPTRWSLEELEKMKLPGSVGPVGFAAQYQGDPVPAGGALFAPGWFENRYEASDLPRVRRSVTVTDARSALEQVMVPMSAARPLPAIKIQSIDSAWKDGVRNDRTAIATLVSDMREIFVSDLWVGRVKYTDLQRVVLEQYDKHLPRAIYVEEAASGLALIPELRRTARGMLPVVAVKPGRDTKEARAESVTGWFESLRVRFPVHAPWMADVLHEFLRFPHAKHDDIVDAIVRGVIQMQALIARIARTERSRAQAQGLEGWMER